MSTVKEPEVVDLDFTYGDKFVHVTPAPNGASTGHTLCGAPRSIDHVGHLPIQPGHLKFPHKCGCGASICPVCLHIAKTEYEK